MSPDLDQAPSPSRSALLEQFSLAGSRWKTFDPFLFCVHHLDLYPAGNEALGPAAPLAGRNLGRDFENKDGWSMYHGEIVPGFPRHPHRGFETITVTRRGLVDHSDSLGAAARYGHGDVQWMTAGRGIVHAEMFPLIESESANPAELFQIWLNLPSRSKMVAPHFSMFWGASIQEPVFIDQRGSKTSVRIVAGNLLGHAAPAPPPDSWAARREAGVAVWSVRMEPGARWVLPAGPPAADRTLYYFSGEALTVSGETLGARVGFRLATERAVELVNGSRESELLLLQGRPIGEAIVQHGPFVMNTRDEIEQAISDYRATGFGGWPFQRNDPVHPRDRRRFAVHADGRSEEGA